MIRMFNNFPVLFISQESTILSFKFDSLLLTLTTTGINNYLTLTTAFKSVIHKWSIKSTECKSSSLSVIQMSKGLTDHNLSGLIDSDLVNNKRIHSPPQWVLGCIQLFCSHCHTVDSGLAVLYCRSTVLYTNTVIHAHSRRAVRIVWLSCIKPLPYSYLTVC